MTIYNELKPLFNPKRVAIIGASRKRNSIGWSILKNFIDSRKFRGSVYPVNPNADEILGKKSYDSVLDIRKNIDHALIVVPAKIVPSVMHDCVDKEVKTASIISSGFSEIGNKRLELEVKHIADKSEIRVVGPNCLGVFDSNSGVDTLFLPKEKLGRPRPGNISFISQSGAVGSVILDWIASEGYGISKFVSYGNAMDLDESDFIEYLSEDKSTDVICVYLEGTKNGRRLMNIGKRVTKKKPVIIIKAGRTKEGTIAVSSHTGSLAGADEVYDAAFKQAGIIRANDIGNLFDYAQALSNQPLPNGDNILVITNGGGFGVLSTDEIIARDLKLAKFSEKTKKALKKVLPSYANIHNPLDLIGDADAKRYENVLKIIEKDKNIDAVFCITLFQTVSLEPKVVDVLTKFNKRYKKPLIVCSSGGKYSQKNLERLECLGIPVYDTPTKAADALKVLVDYSRIKR